MKLTRRIAQLLVPASICLAACGTRPAPAAGVTRPPVGSASARALPPKPSPRKVVRTLAEIGLDGTALDRTADPCDDFYQFACGSWLARTQIPSDKPAYGRSFNSIWDTNEAVLHQILEDAAAGKIATDAGKKLGAFYEACMDEAAAERTSLAPVEPYRKIVRKVKDLKTLAAAITEMDKARMFAVFEIGDMQDFNDATRVIAYVNQAGMGLPEKDFYFREDDKSKEIRKKYVEHLSRQMTLAGLAPKEAKMAGDDAMKVEIALAKIAKTNVELLDLKGIYNRLDRAGLKDKAPNFPWDDYFAALGFSGVTEIDVTSVQYVTGLNELLSSIAPGAWRHFLDVRIVSEAAPWASKKLADESFAGEQILSGQPEIRPRWKRCVAMTDTALGEMLGELFVEKRFVRDSKVAADRMVGAVRDAFVADVRALPWMDEKTKMRARTKSQAITYLVGHPSKWRRYDFAVSPSDVLANVLASQSFELRRKLRKVGKPLDREEWDITPPTVNAYADSQKGQMVFPAGILQAPFFSQEATDPVNLGGIGMVIGHELTHHFDDRGSQFDEVGNMVSWWEPQTGAQFAARGQCLVDQYGAYEGAPGVKIDGKLTLSENIADIGGVKLAFAAYRSLRANATEVDVADGFDEDQQFFLGFGQAWCTVMRDDTARTWTQTNEHSVPKWRVDGALADTQEFATAFQCPVGKRMHPTKACAVW